MDSESCVIYVRISFDRAGLELGVERQERACRELAERQGWTVTEVYRDNSVSATSKKPRPAFERMLAAQPVRILMWSVDRLVRKGPDLERLIDLEVPIHSCQAGPMDLTTASGRLNARLLVSVATFEGDIRTERQRLANRQRREAGKPGWSKRPFGFEKDGTHREEEAALIREAYDRWDRGENLEEIRKWLDSTGVKTVGGYPWIHSTVRTILRHPRNAGLLRLPAVDGAPSTLIKGTWEPILPEADWRRIVEGNEWKNRAGRGQGKRKALLSSILTCGKCGGPLRKGVQPRTGRAIYCGPCTHVTVPMEEMDFVVRMMWVLAYYQRTGLPWETQTGDGLKKINAEIETLEGRRDDLADMLATGELDRESYARAITTVRERLREAKEEAASITPDPDVKHLYKRTRGFVLNDGSMTLAEQRLMVTSTFSKVVALPKNAGARFAPEKHVRLYLKDGTEVIPLPKEDYENIPIWNPDMYGVE